MCEAEAAVMRCFRSLRLNTAQHPSFARTLRTKTKYFFYASEAFLEAYMLSHLKLAQIWRKATAFQSKALPS